MKKLTYLLGIALMATSMVFVSCDDKDENTTNNNNSQDYPEMNLSGFNFAHQWDIHVTHLGCPDFSAAVREKVQAGIDAGNLEMSFYGGDDEDESNNYRDWILDFCVPNEQTGNGMLVVARLDINYYNPTTQRLYLGTNEDDYDGNITLTQDGQKINFEWEAHGDRDYGIYTSISGYINKADVRF